jgi:predicted O-methyltransferase YrrM
MLRICETGFNAGHSAIVLLEALAISRTATYLGFDLGDGPFTRGAAAFINTWLYPGRLRLVIGDSAQTLAPMLSAEPTPSTACDLVSIDGNHTPLGVVADVRALRQHISPGAIVFLDDVDVSHVVWRERSLRRVGCVSLSGFADNEFVGKVGQHPWPASSSFCVAMASTSSQTQQ